MIVLEAQKELEDKSGHFYMQNFMTLRLVMVSGGSRAIRSLSEQKIEISDHESPLLQTSPDPPSPSSLDPTVGVFGEYKTALHYGLNQIVIENEH